MTVRARVSGIDYTLEGTSAGFNMIDVTAANFDAQVTSLGIVQTAIQAVSLIDFEGQSMYAVDDPAEQDQPVSPYAQRESKWLCSMTDDVTAKSVRMEIGGADLTLLVGTTEFMDLTAGAGLALKAAIEAEVVSDAGNAVTLNSVKHVGRNV